MKLIDLFVLFIILAVIGLAVRMIVKSRGKTCSCTGSGEQGKHCRDCSHCTCCMNIQQKSEKNDIPDSF